MTSYVVKQVSLTSHASHVLRHRDLEVDDAVLRLTLLDVELGLASRAVGVTGQVHVASVRTFAILADLGDLDINGAALCDLRNGLCDQLVLGVLANVDVAGENGTAAFVDDVVDDLLRVDDVCVGLRSVDYWFGIRLLFVLSFSLVRSHLLLVAVKVLPWRGKLAAPLPCALRITPWAEATANKAEVTKAFMEVDMVGLVCEWIERENQSQTIELEGRNKCVQHR